MDSRQYAFGPRPIAAQSRELMDVEPAAVGSGELPNGESLVERVGRAKARWLRRVMYETSASSTQKCFAYAVADHLNCVTLDCWPSQSRLMKLLGFKSAKTLQRAARGLEETEVLTIKGGGRNGYRYAPVFMPGDADKIVPLTGLSRPAEPDKNVSESFLVIHPNKCSSTEVVAEKGRRGQHRELYQRRQRGAIEIKLAELLGPNGMEVLNRLAQLDDVIVDRLCRAYSADALSERELIAARLAAAQVR